MRKSRKPSPTLIKLIIFPLRTATHRVTNRKKPPTHHYIKNKLKIPPISHHSLHTTNTIKSTREQTNYFIQSDVGGNNGAKAYHLYEAK